MVLGVPLLRTARSVLRILLLEGVRWMVLLVAGLSLNYSAFDVLSVTWMEDGRF